MTISSFKINFWIVLPFHLTIGNIKVPTYINIKILVQMKPVTTASYHSKGRFLLKLSVPIFWAITTLASNMSFPYLLHHSKPTALQKNKRKKRKAAGNLILFFQLFHLPELLRGEHDFHPLHVPHQQPLGLQELVIGFLPRVFQLVVLLPLLL